MENITKIVKFLTKDLPRCSKCGSFLCILNEGNRIIFGFRITRQKYYHAKSGLKAYYHRGDSVACSCIVFPEIETLHEKVNLDSITFKRIQYETQGVMKQSGELEFNLIHTGKFLDGTLRTVPEIEIKIGAQFRIPYFDSVGFCDCFDRPCEKSTFSCGGVVKSKDMQDAIFGFYLIYLREISKPVHVGGGHFEVCFSWRIKNLIFEPKDIPKRCEVLIIGIKGVKRKGFSYLKGVPAEIQGFQRVKAMVDAPPNVEGNYAVQIIFLFEYLFKGKNCTETIVSNPVMLRYYKTDIELSKDNMNLRNELYHLKNQQQNNSFTPVYSRSYKNSNKGDKMDISDGEDSLSLYDKFVKSLFPNEETVPLDIFPNIEEEKLEESIKKFINAEDIAGFTLLHHFISRKLHLLIDIAVSCGYNLQKVDNFGQDYTFWCNYYNLEPLEEKDILKKKRKEKKEKNQKQKKKAEFVLPIRIDEENGEKKKEKLKLSDFIKKNPSPIKPLDKSKVKQVTKKISKLESKYENQLEQIISEQKDQIDSTELEKESPEQEEEKVTKISKEKSKEEPVTKPDWEEKPEEQVDVEVMECDFCEKELPEKQELVFELCMDCKKKLADFKPSKKVRKKAECLLCKENKDCFLYNKENVCYGCHEQSIKGCDIKDKETFHMMMHVGSEEPNNVHEKIIKDDRLIRIQQTKNNIGVQEPKHNIPEKIMKKKEKGDENFKKKQFRSAIICYNEALRLCRTHKKEMCYILELDISGAYFYLKQYKESFKHAQLCLFYKKDFPKGCILLFYSCLALGNSKKAEELLSKICSCGKLKLEVRYRCLAALFGKILSGCRIFCDKCTKQCESGYYHCFTRLGFDVCENCFSEDDVDIKNHVFQKWKYHLKKKGQNHFHSFQGVIVPVNPSHEIEERFNRLKDLSIFFYTFTSYMFQFENKESRFGFWFDEKSALDVSMIEKLGSCSKILDREIEAIVSEIEKVKTKARKFSFKNSEKLRILFRHMKEDNDTVIDRLWRVQCAILSQFKIKELNQNYLQRQLEALILIQNNRDSFKPQFKTENYFTKDGLDEKFKSNWNKKSLERKELFKKYWKKYLDIAKGLFLIKGFSGAIEICNYILKGDRDTYKPMYSNLTAFYIPVDDEEFFSAVFVKSLCLEKIGKGEDAINFLEIVLETRPCDKFEEVLYKKLAVLYLNLGNYEKGRKYCAKIKSDFQWREIFETLLNVITYHNLDATITKLEDLEKHMKEEEGFRESVLFFLGLVNSNMKNYKKSLEYYKKLKPSLTVFVNMGYCYRKLTTPNYQEALKNYSEALKLSREDDDFAGVLNNIGELFVSQGKIVCGRQYYKEALGWVVNKKLLHTIKTNVASSKDNKEELIENFEYFRNVDVLDFSEIAFIIASIEDNVVEKEKYFFEGIKGYLKVLFRYRNDYRVIKYFGAIAENFSDVCMFFYEEMSKCRRKKDIKWKEYAYKLLITSEISKGVSIAATQIFSSNIEDFLEQISMGLMSNSNEKKDFSKAKQIFDDPTRKFPDGKYISFSIIKGKLLRIVFDPKSKDVVIFVDMKSPEDKSLSELIKEYKEVALRYEKIISESMGRNILNQLLGGVDVCKREQTKVRRMKKVNVKDLSDHKKKEVEIIANFKEQQKVFQALNLFLIGGLESFLKRGELVNIILDGELFEIPIGCLLDEKGEYFVEKCPFSIQISLLMSSICLKNHEKGVDLRKKETKKMLLLLGNVMMDCKREMKNICNATKDKINKCVTLSRKEDEQELKEFSNEVKEATLENLKCYFSSKSKEHPLVFGYIDHNIMINERSSNKKESHRGNLALVGGNHLTPSEIMKNDFLRVLLIFLSSCSTLKGDVVKKEGTLGVYRAFLLARASSLIVTVCDITSGISGGIFTNIFKELCLKNVSSTVAIRNAVITILKKKSKIKKNSHNLRECPLYWGVYQVLGVVNNPFF